MSDAESLANDNAELPLLTRADIVDQLRACRAGTLSQAALAAWAFKQFYDEDLELLEFEEEADEEIRDILDTLMFCDDPHFALDDAALDALVKQLQA
jgi:hypothetical protein